MGLEAESHPLRVPVFGAKSVVTDSKTVTAQLESLDGGAKKEILLWTTPNIYEMKAVDWFHTKRSLSNLCDLEIPKPAGLGDVDLLIGSDYYAELLLPLEHHVGKPGEPLGVKSTTRIDNCWACSRRRQPAIHTRLMRTLLQKCGLMTWCGRRGIKIW